MNRYFIRWLKAYSPYHQPFVAQKVLDFAFRGTFQLEPVHSKHPIPGAFPPFLPPSLCSLALEDGIYTPGSGCLGG